MRVEGYVDLCGVWLWLLVLQCQLTGRFHSLAFPSGWLNAFVSCCASSSEKLRSLRVLRGELQNVCALQCKSLQWHLSHSAAMMQCCQCLLDQGQNPLCCLSFGSMDRFLKLKNRMAVSADANMSTWLAGYANVANWLPECKHCATETTQLVKKFLTSPSVACVHWQVTSSVLDTLQLGVGIILCLYFVSCNLVNLLTSWLISHASVWLN